MLGPGRFPDRPWRHRPDPEFARPVHIWVCNRWRTRVTQRQDGWKSWARAGKGISNGTYGGRHAIRPILREHLGRIEMAPPASGGRLKPRSRERERLSTHGSAAISTWPGLLRHTIPIVPIRVGFASYPRPWWTYFPCPPWIGVPSRIRSRSGRSHRLSIRPADQHQRSALLCLDPHRPGRTEARSS